MAGQRPLSPIFKFDFRLGFDDNDDDHWRGVERIGAVWNGSGFEEWVEAFWDVSGTQLKKLWSWGFVEWVKGFVEWVGALWNGSRLCGMCRERN